MVRDWARDRQANPGQTQVMMAFRREEVALANSMAREALQKAGSLGPSESIQTTQGAREFAVGDRIYFLKNDRDLGVKNGSLGTVEKLKGGQMLVRLDGEEKRQVAFDSRAYEAIDHGYAATVHKAQGLTAGRAYVLGSELYDRNVINVAMTRHTEQAKLYISKEAFPTPADAARAFSKERPKDLTLDYDDVAREADRLKREAAERQEAARREREQVRARYEAERAQAARQASIEQRRPQAAQRLTGPGVARATERPLEQKLERDPAAEGRATREARMQAFGQLEHCYAAAQRQARQEPLTVQQAWEARQEVASALSEREFARKYLRDLTQKMETFKREHPFKAMFGAEPRYTVGYQKTIPLSELIGQTGERSLRAEREVQRLRQDPELVASVNEEAAAHNAKIRGAKEELPKLAKAYERAMPQQKLDREVRAQETAKELQLERGRSRGRGMEL